jgi:hypothetical protein
MTGMTEDQLERETLGWLADVGCTHAYSPGHRPGRSRT